MNLSRESPERVRLRDAAILLGGSIVGGIAGVVSGPISIHLRRDLSGSRYSPRRHWDYGGAVQDFMDTALAAVAGGCLGARFGYLAVAACTFWYTGRRLSGASLVRTDL